MAEKISKADDWTLYHEATSLGQGSTTCHHHVALQIGIKGEKEGDEPQVFTLGSLPAVSVSSADGVKAIVQQIASVCKLVEMVQCGATAADYQMSEALTGTAIATKIGIQMIKHAMQDHAPSCDKMDDLLEEMILE